jgi:WD40 repeat protein
MATVPPLPPDASGIRVGNVGGDVNFSALGDIVGGDKITTITTTIQISVEAVTQRPLITTSPYRGLDRFEDRDKDLFFGRDQLIKSLLAQLGASNVLLVLGASGSGKSSVVRAGLLPQLSQLIGARFRYFTFVPDVNPFESLRSSLQAAGFSQAQTRELAEAGAETPAKLIRGLQRAGDQWLFFVDQFEEIFTVGDEKLRANFIAALTQIAQERNSSTKLVLAMRADFLDRFSPFSQFAKIIEKNIDIVADMHADELRQAIEQPAARHGVVFEQGLVEEIIKDVQGQAGSLPLLQYTLDLLWQEEAREDGLADRHLNTKAYRELGGVRGALQKRANEIYSSFGDAADSKTASSKQEIVRQIFLRLVDLAGEGSNDAAWRPVRRRASIAMFATAQEQEILQALINQKLLVSNREGDDATVEVAHEALFTSWGRLKNWIDAGKQVIFARNRLADDAHRWQTRQEEGDAGAEEELLGGSRLAQALDMRARGDFVTVVGGLGETETQFLDASTALRDRRAVEEQARQQRELEAAKRLAEARTLAAGRLRKGLAIAVVLALLAIGGGFLALRQSWKATEQERKAKTEGSRSEYLRALSLVEESDADQALRSLARSLELDPSNSAVATRLITLLGQRQWPHFAATQSHPLPIGSLTKNADGSRVIVATRSAGGGWGQEPQFIYLHDAETLGPVGSVEMGSDVTDLQVSGDRVLATGLFDNSAVLLNAKTGTMLKTWKGALAKLGYGCTFSSDGKWALVWWWGGDKDGEKLEVVSVTDGKPHPRIKPIPSRDEFAAVMMNDEDIRILSNDGGMTIQSLKNPDAAPSRVSSVVPDLENASLVRFGFAGNILLTVHNYGIGLQRFSEAGANNIPLTLKGVQMFALESYLGRNYTMSGPPPAFNGADHATIIGQNLGSSSARVRSCVAQIARRVAPEPGFEIEADWHSLFAPVCLLGPGIAVAQETKGFILPFHGGFLSGPLRHESQITAICGIREGLLATGSADGMVKLWNVTSPVFLAMPQSGPRPMTSDEDRTVLARSRSHDVEIWQSGGLGLIKRAGKEINIQAPKVEELASLPINSAELSADSELGIFTVFRRGAIEGETSGAWLFSTKDGALLSDSVGKCEWAGFTPDQQQVLTISHGSLHFWNLRRNKDGRTIFEATGPALTQANMAVAVVADHGALVMTRSVAGEVIVWDRIEGKPLHWLRRDPLWNDVDLDSEVFICKPAVSANARRYATAFGRALVVWDADSGKPLSDPVYCAAQIRELDFPPSDSSKVEATLTDGSKVSWDYADLTGAFTQVDATTLQQLAMAVADDKWLDEAPRLAAEARPSSPAVTKLLEHFASQARALRANALRPAPASSPALEKVKNNPGKTEVNVKKKEDAAMEARSPTAPPKTEETIPGSTRNDLARADARLNEAYGALRVKLGTSEKEALKREQIEWLAKRDKIIDEVKRLEFILERARDLEQRGAAKK